MNTDILEKLLCFGLFPEKLSWVLSSKSFGKKVLSKPLPNSIVQNQGFYYCNYNQTRESNGLRRLGIPNPYPYYLLCYKIAENWDEIEKVIGDIDSVEYRSMIRPKMNNYGNRLISMKSYNKSHTCPR
jgi:hypothetical protein